MSYRVAMIAATFYACWWIAGGVAAVLYLPGVMA